MGRPPRCDPFRLIGAKVRSPRFGLISSIQRPLVSVRRLVPGLGPVSHARDPGRVSVEGQRVPVVEQTAGVIRRQARRARRLREADGRLRLAIVIEFLAEPGQGNTLAAG